MKQFGKKIHHAHEVSVRSHSNTPWTSHARSISTRCSSMRSEFCVLDRWMCAKDPFRTTEASSLLQARHPTTFNVAWNPRGRDPSFVFFVPRFIRIRSMLLDRALASSIRRAFILGCALHVDDLSPLRFIHHETFEMERRRGCMNTTLLCRSRTRMDIMSKQAGIKWVLDASESMDRSCIDSCRKEDASAATHEETYS